MTYSKRIRGSEAERFWGKVHKMPGECWIWLAAVNEKGYGIFRLDSGRNARAHRWAYEQLVGPIPDGMGLDHTCTHQACVNPDHLEPVTTAENAKRALPGGRSNRRLKTHCPQGHAYSDENTYFWGGSRHCRTCRAARRRPAGHRSLTAV